MKKIVGNNEPRVTNPIPGSTLRSRGEITASINPSGSKPSKNKRLLPTLQECNLINQKFWDEQSRLFALHIENRIILQVAMQQIESEQVRQVPVRCLKSMEMAVHDARWAMSLFQVELSRKGGKAAKSDSLQRFILDTARNKPYITDSELLELLRENRNFEIDGGVFYFTNSGGREKTVAISGLKDRLYRAKKKIYSR